MGEMNARALKGSSTLGGIAVYILSMNAQLIFAVNLTLMSAMLCASDATVDFTRDVKPILSNVCFKCHGPDAAERKGGTKARALRLDTPEGAYADYGGAVPIVPGHPEKSDLVERISSTDDETIMPPRKSGRTLTAAEIEVFKKWVSQGAKYAKHWSYVKPESPPVPETDKQWSRNAIDAYILARLKKEGLKPQPEADRNTLIRRLALDLTGLPPSLEAVDAFAQDGSADAYEKLVDRLLAQPAYGERWAGMWLDLARYADSGGYASDTPRTIWAYRDYAIKSFNENKPFDQFTLEQIAGDLLPNPTQEQLIATAFHRNTMTNTEGGTSRDEFRNAAVIDRAITTMAVWMGTSFTCAQCHDHKYDPLPQKDFFRFFAMLNNTEDYDRQDEEPTLKFSTPDQEAARAKLETELSALEKKMRTPTPAQSAAQAAWEKRFPLDLKWTLLAAGDMAKASEGGKQLETITAAIPPDTKRIGAIRLDAVKLDAPKGKEKSVVVSRVSAALVPSAGKNAEGRFVRIELNGTGTHLMLAEVQVFSGGENVALKGAASQISTDYGGEAKRAIDGNTEGDYFKGNSVSHTGAGDNLWWEVDLKATRKIEKIAVWNRTDGGAGAKLNNFFIIVLDDQRKEVWRAEVKESPSPSKSVETGGARAIQFVAAHADSQHDGFDAAAVIRDGAPKDASTLSGKAGAKKKLKSDKPGWSINSADGKNHFLTLIPAAMMDVPAGSKLELAVTENGLHVLDNQSRYRVSITADPRADELSRTPPDVVQALGLQADKRSDAERETVAQFYLETIAPDLKADRERISALKKELGEIKQSTVPIMRELAGDKRRKTRVQLRGNYLALGDEVSEGVPEAFHPLPPGAQPNRLGLAKWLVDEHNPLTARVIANRYWEQIFGIGIVRTSEEFGSQGDQPVHPELLDWLATELVRGKWDMKRFVKLLVLSSAYRQSSKVSPELTERDPENRLLARGPRFRLSAETVRDQALAVSGLLSPKMYGPPVRPARPAMGLSAAFGGGLDWQTSAGEDRYRRAIYTEMRRTAPYPSSATFDAPSREICTLRRVRTNTPLQALVTLNDPVFVEAAQALARRMVAGGSTDDERAKFGFRVCLSREPQAAELARIVRLQSETRAEFLKDAGKAKELAGNPLGALPPKADAAEFAAWTAVANVLLNLDETLMKR